MKALEFEVEIDNGTVKIPKRYLNELKKRFRIIILLDEEVKPRKNMHLKDKFKSMKLDTEDFEFDRDEAHER